MLIKAPIAYNRKPTHSRLEPLIFMILNSSNVDCIKKRYEDDNIVLKNHFYTHLRDQRTAVQYP